MLEIKCLASRTTLVEKFSFGIIVNIKVFLRLVTFVLDLNDDEN